MEEHMAKAPQLVTPAEKIAALGSFEGRQVIGTGIEIPGAAGGLRDALTIDPQALHADETVYVVLECRVKKIRHDPIHDSLNDVDLWKRVHVLDTQAATIVDRDIVVAHLEEQARLIEEARGIQRLDFGVDGDTDEMVGFRGEHIIGEHAAGKVDGCPMCDDETAAEADEAAEDAGNVTPMRPAKKAAAKKAPAK
jgi:hypothetical protein